MSLEAVSSTGVSHGSPSGPGNITATERKKLIEKKSTTAKIVVGTGIAASIGLGYALKDGLTKTIEWFRKN